MKPYILSCCAKHLKMCFAETSGVSSGVREAPFLKTVVTCSGAVGAAGGKAFPDVLRTCVGFALLSVPQ